jgi:GNAT superfamily N-acetyltransferase
MPTLEVHSATESERDTVIGVITLAFAADPMARWSFPGPATYLTVMPQLAAAFAANGFRHGAAHLIDGGMGAAMWLPPGIAPDAERLMTLSNTHAPKDRVGDMLQVFEQMDRYRPSEPCWYLPLIGVDPAHQGRGCGSALMRYALAQCDRDGVPAYLESSNPRNLSLYLRHGFEAIGEIQVGSSPTMVPMLRRPR